MASLGFIGRDEVAALMDITPGRVSQLQTEDPQFPQPSFSIGKTRVWRKDAIVAYQRGRKGRTTLSLHSIQAPTSPLPRVLDQIVTLTMEPGLIRSVEIYVRVWRGQTTVALIEELDSSLSIGLTNRIEYYTSQLVRLFPQILSEDVCWIQSNRSSPTATQPTIELVNVVLEREPNDTLSNPQWVYFDGFEPLATVIGDPEVELYPAGTLTQTNIRQFQRNGGPIEVIANEEKIAQRMETIRIFQNAPLSDTDKATALDYLVTGLQLVDDNARTELSTAFWQYEEHRRQDSGDFTPRWAVIRNERRLTDDERTTAQTLSLPYTPNARKEPFDRGRLMSLLHALHDWSEDIDDYADHPNPDLYGQVKNLAAALPTFIADDELKTKARRIVEDMSRPFIARFSKNLAHVRQYLDDAGEMVPRARPDQQREQRMLAKEVAYSRADDEAYFGFDRFGNHMAQSLESHSYGDEGNIAVLWPREPSPVSIADHILICGSHDTLAFIANPDQTLRGLLPRVETPSSVGWTTGYGGTGPVDLVDAVCNVLTSSGLRPNTQQIRNAIIPNSTPETVWLKVEDIVNR